MKTTLLSTAIAGVAFAGLALGVVASASAKPIKATYTCDKGQVLRVVFTDGQATVTTKTGWPIALTQAVTADGFEYTDGKHILRGKGRDVMWTPGNYKPIHCRATK